MLEALTKILEKQYTRNFELYKYLHQNPELSLQEVKSADRLCTELEKSGLEVTRNFWGNGFVAVLKNGDGPVIMMRTDLDALPIEEKTGCEFSSQQTGIRDDKEVSIMHACGHDMHMTVLTGTAKALAEAKDLWKGTVIFIGQPAEETGNGAKEMIAAGLFKIFPKPEAILAYHIAPEFEAGKIGYVSGYSFANVDMLDLTVYGVGGHGAGPHKTKDPIVLASKIILSLQTIVSRELPPLEPAVISVGSIHGGTTHNIIPSSVKLEITARSYSDDVRDQIVKSIQRVANGIAEADGIPEALYPELVVKDSYAPAVYNDPDLILTSANSLKEIMGKENVIEIKPEMIAEDFAWYGRTEDKIPIAMLRLGTVNKEVFAKSKREGTSLPSLHSPFLFPDTEPTIKTGILGMTSIIIKRLQK